MLFAITLTGCKEGPVYIKQNSIVFLYSYRECCKELLYPVSTRSSISLSCLWPPVNAASSFSIGNKALSIGQRDEERLWQRRAPPWRCKEVKPAGWIAPFSRLQKVCQMRMC